MSAESNAQIVRESIEVALIGNWDRLGELYAEDAVMEGTPKPVYGNEAIVNLWRGCHDEVPGIRGEIINLVAQDNVVIAEWRVGADLKGAEVYVCKLRDGKIISNRIYGFSGGEA